MRSSIFRNRNVIGNYVEKVRLALTLHLCSVTIPETRWHCCRIRIEHKQPNSLEIDISMLQMLFMLRKLCICRYGFRSQDTFVMKPQVVARMPWHLMDVLVSRVDAHAFCS